MTIFLKWKKCEKCGYTGNMDYWNDEKFGDVYKCPICHKKLTDNKEG